MDLNLDPKRTAFLTLFTQNTTAVGITRNDPALLDRIAAAQDVARRAGVEVMHVGIAFDPEYLVMGPWSNFHEITLRERQAYVLGTEGADFHPKVAPAAGELALFTQCSAALVGTPLEEALRARDISTIVVTGMATQGSVKHLVIEATNRFYDVVVLRDCCIAGDPEIDPVLMDKLFPTISRVVTGAEFERVLA